jgi:UDP-N-acetylmuramoylalanine--D-glutamate ligase
VTARFEGKKIAVVGLGAVANPPLIEFLVDRGAYVTACDRKIASELGAVYDRLSNLPIRFNLGADYLSDLDGYDTVYLTPAIRRDLSEIIEAKEKGVEFSSEILLFMRLCAAPKIGITGSSGKTTTTTVTGDIGCNTL